jgi:hypothetical protein
MGLNNRITGSNPVSRTIPVSIPLTGASSPPRLDFGNLNDWLPGFICIVLLTSSPVMDDTYDDEVLYSRLVYCWFAEAIDLPVDQLLKNAIQPFEMGSICGELGSVIEAS